HALETAAPAPTPDAVRALTRYYFLRAGVSAAWVAAAFTVGAANPAVAAALLVAYPAWDAGANGRGALSSGGFRANASQALNVAVSAVTALAVIAALGRGTAAVLVVFGVWASLAGLLQLATAVRPRRTHGAPWG